MEWACAFDRLEVDGRQMETDFVFGFASREDIWNSSDGPCELCVSSKP